MSRYAANTSVSVARSKAEIEETLTRYGAGDFGYMTTDGGRHAIVAFRAFDRNVRMQLEMPDPNDPDFTTTPAGRRRRSGDQAYKAWEQACRQRWRALHLVIKAKLEAVESGISTFEEEFMANIVIPGTNKTIGQWARPQLAAAYESGSSMPLLPSGRKK